MLIFFLKLFITTLLVSGLGVGVAFIFEEIKPGQEWVALLGFPSAITFVVSIIALIVVAIIGIWQ